MIAGLTGALTALSRRSHIVERHLIQWFALTLTVYYTGTSVEVESHDSHPKFRTFMIYGCSIRVVSTCITMIFDPCSHHLWH